MSKEEAALDDWMKDIAPSTELREWFDDDPQRWPEFQRRYRAELLVQQHQDELDRLRALTKRHTVTLVYCARDETHDDAVVLKRRAVRQGAPIASFARRHDLGRNGGFNRSMQ
ncbi:DUF488 domain-containing protein [Caballeronia catudaia]|uniref:DUF488 domain-containing protein n=1 Tax=Caballeronia catudaia TaxID=1777136 RepID=UPI000A98FC5F|nr:DUF488 family protein [Caballeronia catudaia]